MKTPRVTDHPGSNHDTKELRGGELRLLLEIPDEQRVETLVVNSKRHQISSGRKGYVFVCDVVELQILEFAADGTAEAAILFALEVSLKFTTTLDQPVLTDRY